MNIINSCLLVLTFLSLNTQAAESLNINQLLDGQKIILETEFIVNQFCSYDHENKQVKKETTCSLSFQIAKNEGSFEYILTLPGASCVSYSQENRDAFIECLTRAFQNEHTMKYYAERKTFSVEEAKIKATRNADLHARNITANDPRPRFIVQIGDEVIGFVRVGGTDNLWQKNELATGWQRLGFSNQDNIWYDKLGNRVDEHGYGEIAILLEEKHTNKGLGRMLMTAMMKVIMPLCKKIGVLYDDKVIGYIFSTVSADNLRSKRILEEFFTPVIIDETSSHYNDVPKLYYYHRIDDSNINNKDITISL